MVALLYGVGDVFIVVPAFLRSCGRGGVTVEREGIVEDWLDATRVSKVISVYDRGEKL